MGRDGWLGVGWPAEYGGRGLGQVEQQIFANEAARADVPLPAVTLQTVGPTLQAHGTHEQKALLPAEDPGRRAALRHRLHRAGGGHRPGRAAHPGGARRRPATWSTARRSSPPAGTTPTTSGWPAAPTRGTPAQGHLASSSWTPRDPGLLLDPDHHPRRRAPRQRHLLLRRARPGHDAGRARRTPGWRLITTQLNHERVMLGPAGRTRGPARPGARLGRRRTGPDGRPLLEPARRAPGPGRGRRQPAGQRAAQLAGRGRRADGRRRRRVGDQGVRLRAAAAARPAAGRSGRHGTATRPTRRPPSWSAGSTSRPNATPC